jgi:hypothetical protein
MACCRVTCNHIFTVQRKGAGLLWAIWRVGDELGSPGVRIQDVLTGYAAHSLLLYGYRGPSRGYSSLKLTLTY